LHTGFNSFILDDTLGWLVCQKGKGHESLLFLFSGMPPWEVLIHFLDMGIFRDGGFDFLWLKSERDFVIAIGFSSQVCLVSLGTILKLQFLLSDGYIACNSHSRLFVALLGFCFFFFAFFFMDGIFLGDLGLWLDELGYTACMSVCDFGSDRCAKEVIGTEDKIEQVLGKNIYTGSVS